MNKINDGGPAFPCEQHEDNNGNWNQTFDPGISLRDWFAGQAMKAIIAKHPPFITAASNVDLFHYVAGGAYLYADAMLAAREKSNAQE